MEILPPTPMYMTVSKASEANELRETELAYGLIENKFK